MLTCRFRTFSLLVLLCLGPAVRAADPTDNPVATFYAGPEGYPAWTDAIPWSKVLNMKTYGKGKTAFEKFTLALKDLSEGGGILYYPAGTYDFSTMPPGRGLMLTQNVILRGEAPTGRALAADGTLKLATKFVFPFRKRMGGRVPADWNLIGLALAEGYLKTGTDRVGIAWVHDSVYNLRPWTLTLDGWKVAGASSDTRSRAFDLAGRNLWIDGNRFTNTGSAPGKEGEGIVGRGRDGTPIYSWAITHDIHKRGVGSVGSMGTSDASCHGLLIGWNQTPGWVGNAVKEGGSKMTDCAFIANKCLRVVPDKKTAAGLGLPAPLTAGPPEPPAAPTKVTASVYQEDAVKITWAAGSDKAVGFRVERRIAGETWQVIAYRPPQLQGDPENPPAWVDFTAPSGKELTYRVLALDADDTDKSASPPTEAVKLSR